MGELAALGAAWCWALCSLAFASAGRRLGSPGLNLIKLVMTVAMVAALNAVTHGRLMPWNLSHQEWGWLSLSGFVGFFLGDLCLVRALVLIGPRLTVLTMSLWPLMATLTAWAMFGEAEALSLAQWAGVGVTLFGVGWVLCERPSNGRRPHHYLRGTLLAMLGAAGQAVGYVLIKNALAPDGDPFAATQIRALAAIPPFVVLILLRRSWPQIRPVITEPRVLGTMAFGSFIGPFLGVVLSLVAQQRCQIGVASTYMATAPVFILPLVWLGHKEPISWRAGLGALVAVAGLAMLYRLGPPG